MINAVKVEDNYMVFDGEKLAMADEFDKIVPTEDFKGYFLGKTVWGDTVLFTRNGNKIYTFSANEQPVGMTSFFEKVAKNIDVLKKVQATEFFKDRYVRNGLKTFYAKYNDKLVRKALKAKDFYTIYDLQATCESTIKQIDHVFEKKAGATATFNNSKSM